MDYLFSRQLSNSFWLKRSGASVMLLNVSKIVSCWGLLPIAVFQTGSSPVMRTIKFFFFFSI